MKKKTKILVIILAIVLIAGILAVVLLKNKDTVDVSNNSKNSSSMETEYIKIDGIYVDESFKDKNLSLVYLFYTVNANSENMKLSTVGLNMKINDTNKYSSTVEKDLIPYYTNYYYGDIVKTIYVGNSYNMCSTFKVPKGDLKDSKKVKLENSNIKDINKIEFTTDDIKTMENFNKIAENLDKETFEKKYKEEQNKIAKADKTRESKVKQYINGGYYEFYVTIGTKIAKYKIEFTSPNKFVVSNSYGLSNNGTYSVKKEAIILKFPNGMTNTLYYTYEKGEVNLTNTSEAFGTLIEYDPLGESK